MVRNQNQSHVSDVREDGQWQERVDFSVKRHYETHHKGKCDMFAERRVIDKLRELKQCVKTNKNS